MDPQDAVTVGSVILVTLSQLVAIFGTPKLVKGVAVLDQIFKVIVGNYGKAKNKDD